MNEALLNTAALLISLCFFILGMRMLIDVVREHRHALRVEHAADRTMELDGWTPEDLQWLRRQYEIAELPWPDSYESGLVIHTQRGCSSEVRRALAL